MILAVAVYFALASGALAWFLLPRARAHALAWAQRLLAGGVSARRKVAAESRLGARRAARSIGTGSAEGAAWAVRHRAWLVGSAVLLVGAPLVPVALRGFIELDGFDHRVARNANPQVAALLEGEQLVAPPALPPELFATREVEAARPLIGGASRHWELLDPQFRQRLLVVFKIMREQHGYDMVLLEGYRSADRQARLAALGAQVTRAGAFESWHQYGLAADAAFLHQGRIVISEREDWAAAGYARFGEVARSVGLGWGGAWRSIKDLGHVEMPRDGVLKSRAGFEQPTVARSH